MINKKLNLSLKLNKSLSNVGNPDNGPFTPLDQTLRTPVDAPNNPQQQYYFMQSLASKDSNDSIYSNQQYNESDDILTDIDEPSFGTLKTTKNYTLNFTQNFDQLLLSIYSHMLSLPTTTPFSGTIPPSGLLSKVANETMSSLIKNTANSNHPLYDQQSIISYDYLKNYHYQPIFLQLIRKRLIDLCTLNNNPNSKLPTSTTVSITVPSTSSSNLGSLRQSSISNLSLSDLSLSNYVQANQNRSRSSSLSLRKQSLTRNNSYNGNNWLHIGNLNNVRSHNINDNLNNSTDSLQSMQDFVPQALINRSANYNGSLSLNTPSNSTNGFNSMMMDYQTPPNSNKSSISASSITPPQAIQIVQNSNVPDLDDFSFYQSQQRSRSSSRSNSSLSSLVINVENANIQALNALNGNSSNNMETLDSPFMSATTPSEDYACFTNSFPINSNLPENSTLEVLSSTESRINLPNQFSLSEKKRESLKLKRGIH